MAKSVVFDVNLGDVQKQFQSENDLKEYVSGRILTMLKQGAHEAWTLPRPRAFDTDFDGDFLGVWNEDQPVNGRSVEITVGASIRW